MQTSGCWDKAVGSRGSLCRRHQVSSWALMSGRLWENLFLPFKQSKLNCFSRMSITAHVLWPAGVVILQSNFQLCRVALFKPSSRVSAYITDCHWALCSSAAVSVNRKATLMFTFVSGLLSIFGSEMYAPVCCWTEITEVLEHVCIVDVGVGIICVVEKSRL